LLGATDSNSLDAPQPCFSSGRRLDGTASNVPLEGGTFRADGGRNVSSSSRGAGSVERTSRTSSVFLKMSSRQTRAPQLRHSNPRRVLRVAETHEVGRKERPPHTGHMEEGTARPEER
jgi:hypothetical protein